MAIRWITANSLLNSLLCWKQFREHHSGIKKPIHKQLKLSRELSGYINSSLMEFGEQMLMLLCNAGLWTCVILQSVGSKPERPSLTHDSIRDKTQLLNRGNFISPSRNIPEVNVKTLAEFLCSVKLSRNMTCQISVKLSRKAVISFTRVYNLTRWEPLFLCDW